MDNYDSVASWLSVLCAWCRRGSGDGVDLCGPGRSGVGDRTELWRCDGRAPCPPRWGPCGGWGALLSAFGQLSRPLPTTGLHGVATLWLMWLVAPVMVVAVYVPELRWLPLTYPVVMILVSIWIGFTPNSASQPKPRSRRVRMLVRAAPWIVFVILLAAAVVVMVAEWLPVTVVAAVVTLAFTALMSPVIAATGSEVRADREGHGDEGSERVRSGAGRVVAERRERG